LLPEGAVLIIVGLSFYGFAAWGLRGGDLVDRREIASSSLLRGFGLVTVGFFLSELGDKTQLATISIAGNEDGFVAVWIGSTLGMVAADVLAIGVGVIAGKRLPERRLAVWSALLFAVFGTIALVQAATIIV
jgi:putative Ca2+/H+ antiporter (TMEM165/GDT1 family)